MTINFSAFCEELPVVPPTQFPPHTDPPICEQAAVLQYLGFAKSCDDASRCAAMGAIAVAYLRQFSNWRLGLRTLATSRSELVASLAGVSAAYVTTAGLVYQFAPLTFRRLMAGNVGLYDADQIMRAVRRGDRVDSEDSRQVVPLRVASSPVTLYEALLTMLNGLRGKVRDETLDSHIASVQGLVDDWKGKVEEAPG